MTEVPFKFFDCDNHYYEPLDAFTRHIEPEFARRAVSVATINGRQRVLTGEKVLNFIPNPTFDPVAAPGALDQYFRGHNPESRSTREMFGKLEPIRPAYRNRDARLALMDEQGMAATILLPTLGVGVEQSLRHDIPAVAAAFRAFNRWMLEEWGFAHEGRIFAAPYITLSDPALAAAEVTWALEHDTRFIVMVPGPVQTAAGLRSPADRMFDRFWSVVNEAGITTIYHTGSVYYETYFRAWAEPAEDEAFSAGPLHTLISPDGRSIHDTLASFLTNKMFERFPRLRIAAIELGCDWLFELVSKLAKAYGQAPKRFPEDPRETLRRHLWVSPFYEDRLGSLRDLIGADRILMGSDFPHVEGLTEPSLYIKDLHAFDYSAEDIEKVMRSNGYDLATPLGR